MMETKQLVTNLVEKTNNVIQNFLDEGYKQTLEELREFLKAPETGDHNNSVISAVQWVFYQSSFFPEKELLALKNHMWECNNKTEILEELKTQNPILATYLSNYFFSFEDIVYLTNKDIKKIIRHFSDISFLSKALINAPAEIIEKFRTNMSNRSWNRCLEEMNRNCLPIKDEIIFERNNITNYILHLIENGEIVLNSGKL